MRALVILVAMLAGCPFVDDECDAPPSSSIGCRCDAQCEGSTNSLGDPTNKCEVVAAVCVPHCADVGCDDERVCNVESGDCESSGEGEGE